MPNIRSVARASSITEDNKALIVEVGSESIALIRHKGEYYAYRNRCPHQGGASGEGVIIGNVECSVNGNRRGELYASEENFNLACPWHGLQYDLETGMCRGNPKLRLKQYEVVKEGDDLKLVM
jgi:nitrite reductase (NADH) small subunit